MRIGVQLNAALFYERRMDCVLHLEADKKYEKGLGASGEKGTGRKSGYGHGTSRKNHIVMVTV